MDRVKTNKEGSAKIVETVSVVKTLGLLPHGRTARFTRQEFPVRETTLASTISRLNANAQEYSYTLDPQTADFIITRK